MSLQVRTDFEQAASGMVIAGNRLAQLLEDRTDPEDHQVQEALDTWETSVERTQRASHGSQ